MKSSGKFKKYKIILFILGIPISFLVGHIYSYYKNTYPIREIIPLAGDIYKDAHKYGGWLFLVVYLAICFFIWFIVNKITEEKKREEFAHNNPAVVAQLQRESNKAKTQVKIENTAKLISCEVCKNNISSNAESCPHCGEPMKKRCPKCKSTNIQRIGGLSKGISAGLFGMFAANTVLNDYQCKDCGNKFK